MTPQAELHYQAAIFAAKLLAVRVTRENVRLWAYHMKRMLEAR